MGRHRSPIVIHQKPAPKPLPFDADRWNEICKALGLPPQQSRIAELILCGMRDKQIAAELGLSLPTVRTYLSRIFDRLGVHDRVELILRVFAVAQVPHVDGACHQY